jgi:hypothetical protein
MVLATGTSLYGVLVHDASLGGLKGLESSDSFGEVVTFVATSPEMASSGAHPLWKPFLYEKVKANTSADLDRLRYFYRPGCSRLQVA